MTGGRGSTSLRRRWNYLARVYQAYVLRQPSQLTFWHETPEINRRIDREELGPYYMAFRSKADYPGPYDGRRVPLLDYRGRLGPQYNPIAIAQYGLGNYNLFVDTGSLERRTRFLIAAEWLVDNLEENDARVAVWHHHFDWEYRSGLRAPWYSGLAQGQGVSLLLRAHRETGDARFGKAAERAFESFLRPVDDGGVVFRDENGNNWIEEYIVDPPSHILNGLMWASWGVYDYGLASGSSEARALFQDCVRTLLENLAGYDVGFWSLYEQSNVRLKMLASPFYHRLHIVQLEVMHHLTSEEKFARFAARWDAFRRSRVKSTAALLHKGVFKLCYY